LNNRKDHVASAAILRLRQQLNLQQCGTSPEKERVMSDQNIERGIVEFLKQRQIAGLIVGNVRVDRGTATVCGCAATVFAKRACWECCRRVTGVRSVVDLVEVRAA
jgi:hypothetical protein